MPLGTEVGLGPAHTVLAGDAAPPPERGTAAPTFQPMSIVAKLSPISATVELLLSYLLILGDKHRFLPISQQLLVANVSVIR